MSVYCDWVRQHVSSSSAFSSYISGVHHFGDRLVGLVVKASPSRVEDPGFESCLRRDFSGVESYQ